MTSVLAMMTVFFFMACDNDDSNSAGEDDLSMDISATKVADSSTGSTVTTYNYTCLDLSVGELVTDQASNGWDVAFTGATRIATNSGDSATNFGSSGQGGTAFTGSTDFNTDTDVSSVTFETDYNITTSGHGTSTEPTNVISFPGYDTGDGSTGNPYEDANYGADQYYTTDGTMPPVYTPNNNVYVIKYGDGSGYAKFQVVAVEYSSETSGNVKTTTYYFRVRFQEL